MKKLFPLVFFCLLSSLNTVSQITLSHNIGSTPIKTDWESCTDEEYWARTFTLSEFGISTTEQFIIRSGQIAVSNSYNGAKLSINIHIIDENFPNSPSIPIGGGLISAPFIGDTPEIVQINFDTPIVVPSGAKKILVIAHQYEDFSNPNYKKVLIAGTVQDNDKSWFKGCRKHYTYIDTKNLENPKPNANFFINITGEKLSLINSDSNVNLSHNIGDEVIKTNMFSCSSGGHHWARKFILKDFGVDNNEEYIIDKGFIGFSEALWVSVEFNIYKIDENFPSSFSESDLIGQSQIKEVPYFSKLGDYARIILVDFETPIVVPADVEKILVVVKKRTIYGDGLAFIAGTVLENNDSWYKGCAGHSSGEFRTTKELWPNPNSNINFYITVNGEVKTIFPFEITNDNSCLNSTNNFSLTNQSEIKSVVWNFDDPSSGINNTSTSIDISHQFSNPGIYNVTATVTHVDNTVYTIPKEIEIFEAPNINPLVSLKQCDNSDINGFSFFNLNEVKEKIIVNPENYTITFHEEKNDAENKETAIINTTKYKNEIVSADRIWARVENTNGCYRVSEVNLIVSTTEIPANFQKIFYKCDDGTNTTDGIATFDFSNITQEIKDIFPVNQELLISYYESEADALSETNAIPDISNHQNTNSPNQQNIYIRVDSKVDNGCLGLGTHITLTVEKVPIANPVTINPECDNDRDGIFAFNTSTIQSTIIGSQTNVVVTYFDENGTPLPSPLPNPFVTTSQTITARVENTTSQDPNGQCYDETTINFVVNKVPIVNPVSPQEQCDDNTDGIFAFDTSTIESTILGNQTGLIVKYFDENNVALPSPLPNPFTTTTQTIKIRVENPIYDVCYEETTVDFIVREKPTVNVINEDIICMNNNPQLQIGVENPNVNYSYTWRDENNIVIGNSANTTVSKGGKYSVIATSIYGCASEEAIITVKKSSKSSITIDDIEVQDDSDNNYIKINTSNLGLGDYEFRLLNSNSDVLFDYRDDPNFENLEGGNYIVEVNDKNNCGSVPFEIALISFPKFFTPNNDNQNDFWQIKGINKSFYKNGDISIFNRYGKLMTKFKINDIGWDGTYNGKILNSNSFWFRIILINNNDEIKTKVGSFSLIRD